jgi:hypothetical protein
MSSNPTTPLDEAREASLASELDKRVKAWHTTPLYSLERADAAERVANLCFAMRDVILTKLENPDV